jgi:hypothetical protein
VKDCGNEWLHKRHKAYILSCYAYVTMIVGELLLSKLCGSVDWFCLAHKRDK